MRLGAASAGSCPEPQSNSRHLRQQRRSRQPRQAAENLERILLAGCSRATYEATFVGTH